MEESRGKGTFIWGKSKQPTKKKNKKQKKKPPHDLTSSFSKEKVELFHRYQYIPMMLNNDLKIFKNKSWKRK